MNKIKYTSKMTTNMKCAYLKENTTKLNNLYILIDLIQDVGAPLYDGPPPSLPNTLIIGRTK